MILFKSAFQIIGWDLFHFESVINRKFTRLVFDCSKVVGFLVVLYISLNIIILEFHVNVVLEAVTPGEVIYS